jgi:hypothetical protein
MPLRPARGLWPPERGVRSIFAIGQGSTASNGLLTRAEERSLFGNLVEYNADKHTRLHRGGEQVEHVYFPLAGMISLLTIISDGAVPVK